MFSIDFKQAFDCHKITDNMEKLGIPGKLIRLVEMAWKKTKAAIKTTGDVAKEIIIDSGVRQGNELLTTLFNIALDGIGLCSIELHTQMVSW